jgi:hypothetical protein
MTQVTCTGDADHIRMASSSTSLGEKPESENSTRAYPVPNLARKLFDIFGLFDK